MPALPRDALVVRPHAIRDIDGAVIYFVGVSPELAQRFMGELNDVIDRLLEFPASGQRLERRSKVHVAHLRRFHYTIFYVPTDTSLEVLRLLHNSVSPDKWP